jgi:hypothetical protein
LIVAEHARKTAVRAIVLRRPPNRSNDGIASSSLHRVRNPLPDWAISPPL